MNIVFFEECLITFENTQDIILSENGTLKHGLIMLCITNTQSKKTGGSRPVNSDEDLN